MSTEVSAKVWTQYKGTANKKLLLLALADFANADGWCFPGQQKLSEYVGVGRRSIQRLLDELESDGEVIIYNRVNPDHPMSHMSNLYHLLKYGKATPIPIDYHGRAVKRSVSLPSDSGVTTPSDSGVTTLVTLATHEPSINRQVDSLTSPNGDVPQTAKKAKRAAKPKAAKAWDDVPSKTRAAVIDAWWSSLNTQPTYPVSVYNMPANHEMAAALCRAGYTAEDVKRYVVAMMEDDYWKDKTLTLSKVGELMPAWLKAHPAVTVVQSVHKPVEAELMGQLLA